MDPQESRQVEEIRVQIYRKMTPSQKWKEACRLRETAWKLKTAGVKTQHPDWTDQEVKAEVRKIFLYATT